MMSKVAFSAALPVLVFNAGGVSGLRIGRTTDKIPHTHYNYVPEAKPSTELRTLYDVDRYGFYLIQNKFPYDHRNMFAEREVQREVNEFIKAYHQHQGKYPRYGGIDPQKNMMQSIRKLCNIRRNMNDLEEDATWKEFKDIHDHSKYFLNLANKIEETGRAAYMVLKDTYSFWSSLDDGLPFACYDLPTVDFKQEVVHADNGKFATVSILDLASKQYLLQVGDTQLWRNKMSLTKMGEMEKKKQFKFLEKAVHKQHTTRRVLENYMVLWNHFHPCPTNFKELDASFQDNPFLYQLRLDEHNQLMVIKNKPYFH